MRYLGALVIVLASTTDVDAGEWLDELRSYDLNDYALGLAVTGQENPYVGADSSTFMYPYLTSFAHPNLTDGVLVIRDGELRLRRITDSSWEYWFAGRIRTLGFGNTDAEALRGVEAPRWTVELGPGIGIRRWPVQFHLNAWFEPTGRHSGIAGQLAASYPIETARGYLVPEIAAIYQNDDYNDYYYAVSPLEATPERPEYAPGAATGIKYKVSWGYSLSANWLLSGRLGYEVLSDAIRNSPIVGRDHIWSASLGLAYAPDVFRSGSSRSEPPDPQRFDFRFGLFHTRVDSKVGRDASDGVPGEEIDLEDEFGESDKENVVQLDAFWRLSRYHRIEAGYFELVRTGRIILNDALRYGDRTFLPGVEVRSRSHFKSIRFGYSYSLIRDQQKELGLMAGMHFSSFDAIFSTAGQDPSEESRLDTPLPVFGAHFAVNLRAKTTVAAKAQLFRTDYDDYEGSMNFFAIEVRKQFGEQLNAGLGFNFYRLKLRSSNNDLNGYVDIQHQGPVIFLGYEF